MWNVEISEKGDKKTYTGTMTQQILLGKTFSITLTDGRVFKVVGVRRVLQSITGGTIMVDSSDGRRFRLKVLSNQNNENNAA